ncbi:hypothetical protein SELMODRAFT_423319 [Selaginella moellendorffii]|uniref:Uncharacterized protein n=1 Tax=Selaginella moellendorffii TaxID=88036 RepID=D8SLA2_SELML|nr:hypothetical protein SELMODRAFT_423319 [Selaginella moellendorffii]
MSEKASTFDLLRWSVPFQEENTRNKTPDHHLTTPVHNKFRDYSDIRAHQRASRIHFGDVVTATGPVAGTKEIDSFAEAAKKRDLNESLETDEYTTEGHQSDAKARELVGNVAAKIKQFYGTNPALPDVKESAFLMAHPKKMSDKHTSGTKIKEIGGNYDLFCGQDCLDVDKAPLGFPPIGPHPAKRKEHIGTDGYPPDTRFRYDSVTVPKAKEKYHGDMKCQEMSGNYDLLSYAPNRRDLAGYVKCTPEKSVSMAKRREMVGNGIFGQA